MAEIEWPVIIPADDAEFWDTIDPELQAQAELWATTILWALSGRIFGLRRDVVRPCHRPPTRGSTYGDVRSGVFAAGGVVLGSINATITAARGCGCGVDDCRHQTVADLALDGPIHDIAEIRIDGQVLPTSAYTIRDRRWVRRLDGNGWPTRQNLNAAPTEQGAFVVTYRRGIMPPEAGQFAAGILAVEWVKSREGRDCRLPRGVVSATRNGLSVELDPRAYFTEGMTGIEDVDQWLLSVNPNRLSAPARVVGPRVATRLESDNA